MSEPQTSDEPLVADPRAWLAEDPDPDTRAELAALLAAGDEAEIAARFGARLEFGTAGLRGAMGAGPNRMNRATVRRAAAGLVAWLEDRHPGRDVPRVVIGFDARHKSRDFAEDTVAVVAGAGMRALLLPGPLPTPVLAFAIRYLGAAAGVMVTASHNPAADNGYKVYLGDGAQIVPPVDTEISAAIAAVGPLRGIAMAALDDPLVERVGTEVTDAYVDAITSMVLAPERDVRIVYTAMHGVGRDTLLAAFARAGFPAPEVVAAQAEPDPDFPTVAFPNPEEPGALDLGIAAAEAAGADALVANDPDADRLAVAVPDGDRWRRLTGDELGALLADHVLSSTAGSDRLVVTTVVSSSLLARQAAAAGVHHAVTLTGFKWIARAADDRPGTRFVFGYEEALGYAVGDVVRDKDGIGAALVFAGLAASLKAAGETVPGRLARIWAEHGRHRTRQVSLPMGPAEQAAAMARVRASLPRTLAGRAVTEVEDLLPAGDVIVVRMAGARIVVRPSGTEPKLKLYVEVVDPPGRDGNEGDLAALAAAAEALTRPRRLRP